MVFVARLACHNKPLMVLTIILSLKRFHVETRKLCVGSAHAPTVRKHICFPTACPAAKPSAQACALRPCSRYVAGAVGLLVPLAGKAAQDNSDQKAK